MTTFIGYCMNGNIDDIKKISLKYCDLEEGFILCCNYGHYDIVRYLVELHKNDDTYKPIDIHSKDEAGFRWACKNGHYDIVNYLLKITKKNKPFNNYRMAFKKIDKYKL
jgi:ankyrin repeat protein